MVHKTTCEVLVKPDDDRKAHIASCLEDDGGLEENELLEDDC